MGDADGAISCVDMLTSRPGCSHGFDLQVGRVDADLNAGYIDSDEARKRREEITAEADFYGSMDGASKFVKGDAVAGMFIMLINIVGGLFIGMIQHGLGFGDAIDWPVCFSITVLVCFTR